jgi:hypothetical protein
MKYLFEDIEKRRTVLSTTQRHRNLIPALYHQLLPHRPFYLSLYVLNEMGFT